jgi:hypothetical protein
MSWQEIRNSLFQVCGSLLEPHGYRFVSARAGYERASTSERRGVYLVLVASPHGNHSVQPWCGVRNNTIEKIFHRTSGVDKRYQSSYTTINVGEGHWYLNTREEQQHAAAKLREFIQGVALPFLGKEYSYSDYSALLNTDRDGRCPFHGNAENRCHYGLIAAKLSGDPRFEELKRQYSDFLRRTNRGFYYPRFEEFLKDIDGQIF